MSFFDLGLGHHPFLSFTWVNVVFWGSFESLSTKLYRDLDLYCYPDFYFLSNPTYSRKSRRHVNLLTGRRWVFSTWCVSMVCLLFSYFTFKYVTYNFGCGWGWKKGTNSGSWDRRSNYRKGPRVFSEQTPLDYSGSLYWFAMTVNHKGLLFPLGLVRCLLRCRLLGYGFIMLRKFVRKSRGKDL